MVKVVYGKGCTYEDTFWTGTVAAYPGIDNLNPMFDAAFQIPITCEMLKEAQAGVSAAQASQSHPSPKSSPNNMGSSVRNSVIGMLSKSEKKNTSLIEMTLIDGDSANGNKGHGELGSVHVHFQDLIDARDHTITETRPIGENGARLEYKVILSGIQPEEESDLSDIDTSERDDLVSLGDEKRKVLLTALRGRGFEIHKRGFAKRNDVPDIYLSIPQLNWKTSVVKDDTMPQWNESKLFATTNTSRKIRVDAFDKNSRSKDEYIGTAKFPIDQLLRRRTMEIELQNGSELTGSYVTMQCVTRTTTKENDELNGDALGPLLSASAPSSLSPFNLELDKSVNDEDVSLVGTQSSISMSRRKNMLRSKSLPSPRVIARSVTSFRRGKSKRNTLDLSMEETIQE